MGLGYVGLPLSLQFAESGIRVLGVDLDETKIALLKEGKSYLKHFPSEMIEKQRKAQEEAFAKHKLKVQEEEAKKQEAAAAMENDTAQRINFNDLNKAEEVDIDDIWPFIYINQWNSVF